MYSHLKSRLSPFGLLTSGLVIVTLLTALAGLWHYQYELAHQGIANPGNGQQVSFAPLPSNNQKVTPAGQAGSSDATPSPANTANFRKPSTKPSSQSSQAVGTTGGQITSSGSQQSIVSVALSVNGASKGTVKLAAGSNQCEVLSQALKNGQISSLDMRYSSQYKTQTVYVIDGIGDPGTVWWTYKVNGTAPPYGCTNTPARQGDSVNWQYVKN